jgi:YfiH family protein
MNKDWLLPDWPKAPGVSAVMTTRRGGVSIAPFDTMNVGLRVGDDGTAVSTNRRIFASSLGAEPVFLHQVHGAQVVRLGRQHLGRRDDDALEADAAFTTQAHIACTIQVADCMPVLIAARDASVVGAAHAGWRGAAGGVIENTVAAMCEASGAAASDLVAWMGPCIGPDAFEVGADVLDAFGDDTLSFRDAPRAVSAARPPEGADSPLGGQQAKRAWELDNAMRWRADLPAIVRRRLERLGVATIDGGTWCTVSEPLRFYSFRRDRQTGRHAAAVWIR